MENNINSLTLPGRKFCAKKLLSIGLPLKDIITVTQLSKSEIYNIKNNLTSLIRKERKKVITGDIEKFLKKYLNTFSSYRGGSLRIIKNEINSRFGLNIKSSKPIRTWLSSKNYKRVNKVIITKLPRKNIMKRLSFCRKYFKNYGISGKVLFTDEKKFYLKTKHQ